MTPLLEHKHTRPKLLFVVTEDWYFCSHRLGLAKAALAAGYDVAVACRVTNHEGTIVSAGIRVHKLHWTRSERSPRALFQNVRTLALLYRRERPDLCHHVALKPIVLGGLAGRMTGQRVVISAVAGLGAVFTMRDLRARLIRRVAARVLRYAADKQGWHLLFQNCDDCATLRSLGAVGKSQTHLIRGAGIDTTRFRPVSPSPDQPVTFAVVSRMLTIKGIRDAVEASRLLYAQQVEHRLLLCGAPDSDSRARIPESTLRDWDTLPSVSWLGNCDDVREVWARAHVAIQPSLGGEGLPKSLLEAAACAKPLIATDVPGCREIARHSLNALVVPPGQPAALAQAMKRLAEDPALRRRFGAKSRDLAKTEFSTDVTTSATLKLYRAALQR